MLHQSAMASLSQSPPSESLAATDETIPPNSLGSATHPEFEYEAHKDIESPVDVYKPPQSSIAAMEAVAPPPPPEIHYYGLALVFLCPALGGFLYGYDIGATSFALSMIRSSRDHEKWWYKFAKWKQGLLVATLALGALIGSHIVLVYLSQSIGRRKEIRIAAMLYIIGAILNVMSGTVLAASSSSYKNTGVGPGFLALLVGRLFYGAGVGFIMHGAPTYMAEMSPSHVRGAVVSAKETVIVFGIVVGMLMGDLLSDYPDNWTDLYAFSILGALPMLFLTFKIPRSKRWLLMKGKREEAKESMQFIYKGNVEDEFERMAETINGLCCRAELADDTTTDDEDSVYSNTAGDPKKTAQTVAPVVLADGEKPGIFSAEYRRVMFIGLGLLIFQQFSGQPSVLAYSRVLFEAAGWKGHASVVTVLIMGVTSSFTVALVDRVGRKKLLAAGCLIMASALLVLAYGFWGWDEDANMKLSQRKKNAILWSMFVFISGYQVGFGPITWTVLSEIYPSEIRGTAMALSVEINFLSKFLCQLLFPIIQDWLGWGCTFILFGCTVITGLFFVIFQVPETKGLSLEDIQLKLKGLKPRRAPERQITNLDTYRSDSAKQKAMASPLLEPVAPQRGLTPIV